MLHLDLHTRGLFLQSSSPFIVVVSEPIAREELPVSVVLIDFIEGSARIPAAIDALLDTLSEVPASVARASSDGLLSTALDILRHFHMQNYALLAPKLECVKRWDWRAESNFRSCDIFDFAHSAQQKSDFPQLVREMTQTELFASFIEKVFGIFSCNPSVDADDCFCFFLSNLTRFGRLNSASDSLFAYTQPVDLEAIRGRERERDALLLRDQSQTLIDFSYLSASPEEAQLPSRIETGSKAHARALGPRGDTHASIPLMGWNNFRRFESDVISPEQDNESLASVVEFWEMRALWQKDTLT